MTSPSLPLFALLLLAADGGHAFKGYELYSWEEPQGSWQYALLEGTNRLKAADEIADAAISEDELRRELSDLPAGEVVTWCPPDEVEMEPPFARPPDAVVESLVALARDQDVDLRLCDP